jgi:DNA-binding HxlR family transcriptional regulator
MEEHAIVHREIFRQVPPRVDYSATPLGLSLEPVIMALCNWGRQHAVELNELEGSKRLVIETSAQEQPESAELESAYA